MNHRRAILGRLAAGLLVPTQALARARLPQEAEWILGTWRSDADMSMANFTFQGKRPDAERLARIADLFGKVTHAFGVDQFIVRWQDGAQHYSEKSRLRIERWTSSSVSIHLPDMALQPRMTLYKADGYYCVRSQENFEYFKRQ